MLINVTAYFKEYIVNEQMCINEFYKVIYRYNHIRNFVRIYDSVKMDILKYIQE